MYCLAFTKSLGSGISFILFASTASCVSALDVSGATDDFCYETSAQGVQTMLCQSVASDDGSTNVPSLLQTAPVHGISRIQVPAPQEYADEGEFEVRIVLPKLGQRVMEPGDSKGSDSQQKMVAMVEISTEANKGNAGPEVEILANVKNDSAPPKEVTAIEKSVVSKAEAMNHKSILSAKKVTDSYTGHGSGTLVNLTDSKRKDMPRVTHSQPLGNRKEPVAETNGKAVDSTEPVVDFLQEDLQHEKALLENQTTEFQSAKVELDSSVAPQPRHHKHHKHLLPLNSTYRHQIALTVRHLLEGYLQSAKKHPLLSPLMSSRPKAVKTKRLDHSVAEDGISQLDEPLFGEDGTATSVLYFGCLLLSCCLILWILCLTCWPTAGERFDAALGIGPAVLIGKRAPDFTMTLLDGSLRRLRDITQEGKPVVVKFYNQEDDRKLVSRSSRFSQDAKALELMARDVKYAGNVNFVMVNLQGREAAAEYHNALKLSGALQSTFSGAAILHGGLNGAWCDLSQDYHTCNCPHTTIIDCRGIVVRNYNHGKWWTEGGVVEEDFAALAQTVDDLLKAPCSPGVVME